MENVIIEEIYIKEERPDQLEENDVLQSPDKVSTGKHFI